MGVFVVVIDRIGGRLLRWHRHTKYQQLFQGFRLTSPRKPSQHHHTVGFDEWDLRQLHDSSDPLHLADIQLYILFNQRRT